MKIRALLVFAILLTGNLVLGQTTELLQSHSKQNSVEKKHTIKVDDDKKHKPQPIKSMLKTSDNKKGTDNLVLLDSTKRYSYTTLFDSSAFSRTLYSQQGNNLTSIEYELSDDEQSWVPETKVIEISDENQNIEESTSYYWDKDFGWEESSKYFKEYTDFGELSRKIELHYNNNDWDTSDVEIHEYNQNNMIEEYKRYVNGTSDDDLRSRIEYIYTEFDSISEIITHDYNNDNGSMMKDEKTSFFYNDDNQQSRKIKSDWISGSWVWNRKWDYSYNTEQQNDTIEMFNWDFLTFSWKEDRKTGFEYNENGRMNLKTVSYWSADSGRYYASDRLEKIFEDGNLTWKIIYNHWWSENEFIPDTAWQYQYNNQGLLESEIYYNQYDEEWKGESKDVYGYDEYGNKTVASQYSFSDNSGAWALSYRRFWYYTDLTSTEEIVNKNAIAVYPNPASEKVYLSLDLQENKSDLSVNIYNYKGEAVFSKHISDYNSKDEIIWNCSTVASGTYIAILATKNEKISKKVIVK